MFRLSITCRRICVLCGVFTIATFLCITGGQYTAYAQRSAMPDHKITLGTAEKARQYERYDVGQVAAQSSMQNLQLVLKLNDAKRAALEELITNQQNPSSTDYHHWLTPEEFAALYGQPAEVTGKIAAWLSDAGMTNVQVSRGGLFVSFSGSTERVSAAFHTAIHGYSVNGRPHYANTTAPWMPAEFEDVVTRIRGLDDFLPEPQIAHAVPQYIRQSSNWLGPDDLATIYNMKSLYNAGITGRGVTLAILGQTPLALDDYRAYRNQFGLPPNDFTSISVINAGTGTGASIDEEEATLDLEVAGAVAHNANILYVWGASADAAAFWVVDNQLAQLMSESYAGCETPGDVFYQTLALQANAEGITWVAAAGDSGAAGCDPAGVLAARNGPNVMAPASATNVTAVGGTTLSDGSSTQYWSTANNATNGSALSYIPETGWSDGNAVYGGGGGVSAAYGKPGYQMDIGEVGSTGRLVPDVSFSASPFVAPYAIVLHGNTQAVGGTSAATPLFAGILALVNHYQTANGLQANPGLGQVNPALYQLAEVAPEVFHDVVMGNNDVPCAAGSQSCVSGALGYTAGSGYDKATGLGSVDAYALATNWKNVAFALSSANLGASPLQTVAEQNITFTTKVQRASGPLAGIPVQVYFGNADHQLDTTLIGTTITDATGTAVFATNMLPWGKNTVFAIGTGTATTSATPQTLPVQVTVSPLPSTVLVQSAGGPYLPGQTATFQVQVNVPQGATLAGPTVNSYYTAGTVLLFTANGALITAAALDTSGSATLISRALMAGSNAFYVTYSGNFYVAASESSIFTVTANAPPSSPVGTTTTLTSTTTNLLIGNDATLAVQVIPVAGTVVPSGMVSFLSGSTTLATVSLDASGDAFYIFTPIVAGTYTLTATYSSDAGMSGSTSSPVTITAANAQIPDFILKQSESVTLTAQSSANVQLSIIPLNGFHQPIQLSCSGLPKGGACMLPQSVTPQGDTSVSVILVAGSTSAAAFVPGFSVFALAILLLPMARRYRKLLVTCSLVAALAIPLAGCGVVNGTLSTVPMEATYPITITATSGSIQHQVVINMTIKP